MAKLLCLDVGERRIGLAVGDQSLRMAWPHATLTVDGTEQQALTAIIQDQAITGLVVGRPRNQKGEATPQTAKVEQFVQKALKPLGLPMHWQDESVTSVAAEQRLQAQNKPYTKADIDAEAAAIILQDFLEAQV